MIRPAFNPVPPAGRPIIQGVGPDEPTVTNDAGAKQSRTLYRADLLPPAAILAVAKVLKEGAEKYGEDNWRGIPAREHCNHALVHLFAWLADDEQDDHLEHAACRLLMALDVDLRESDDSPNGPLGFAELAGIREIAKRYGPKLLATVGDFADKHAGDESDYAP